MKSRWSAEGEARFLADCGIADPETARRAYTAALLGAEPALVLCGGGNVSLKGRARNALGEEVETVLVKASGFDLAALDPGGNSVPAGGGMVPLDLATLRKARRLASLSDGETFEIFLQSRLRSEDPPPSLEALVHAWLPGRVVDHTHPEALLLLSNLSGGEDLLREALGSGVIVIPYHDPGLPLAQAAIAAFEANPGARGMAWRHHGLVTWGNSPRESYEATVEIVSRAEGFIARKAAGSVKVRDPVSLEAAWERLEREAPLLRGLLARPGADPDRPRRRVILRPLVDRETLDLLSQKKGKEAALTPPLTSDHVVRLGPFPAWLGEASRDEDPAALRRRFAEGLDGFARDYQAYLASAGRSPGAAPGPRVALLPGVGALCAGRTARLAQAARDLAGQALRVKAIGASLGPWEGLSAGHLASMEFHRFQVRKVDGEELPLEGSVALVTGAAGAIGSGICEALLAAGACVAATDLPGQPLDDLARDLAARFPERAVGVPMDVTDPGSVGRGVGAVIRLWGGVDLGILNAGIAHVSPLADLDIDRFRQLERVNVEGTLLVIRELARLFALQGTGGDLVLVSTKNVFAPGAGFGAYSATKAAAHQLARIASLELAEQDVRVNMVAPDAVFSHGPRKSGLWQEVGPGRMKARGLTEKGLEEYYRDRNLLKARVTAAHVARAVLFFATRQTPTTGATIPVDGGLPDATPR